MHRFGLSAKLGAWSTLLTLVLTWPTIFRLNSGALGSPAADGIKHLWTLWWMREQLLGRGELPYHTQLVNFPDGMTLYPIEPLNGLLACVLFFVPIVAVANIAAMINLTLVGFCSGLLGRELSQSDWGAFAAATLLQCSAVTLFTIHVGVGELQHLWWLPLGGLAWLRMRHGQDLKSALWLAAALAGAVLSCFYHGLFLAMMVSVLSLFTLPFGKGLPRLLGRYALAAGLSLALVLPVLRTFAGTYGDQDPPAVGLKAYVLEEHGQPVTDPASARLDLVDLVKPARDRRPTLSADEEAYGGGRYLGAPALLLALGALLLAPRRAAPWILVGVLGVLLSLGSYMVFNGEELSMANGSRVRMPLLYVNRMLGYVAEPINFPTRSLALIATALAACAALVAGRGYGKLAFGVALLSGLEVQYNQLNDWPMRTLTPWTYEALQPLADAEEGPIADLMLVWRADKESRWASLSAQMAHHQPIHGVPVERLEYFAQSGRFFIIALPLVQDLAPAMLSGAMTLSPTGYREDIALLRDAGFERVQVLGMGGDRRVPPAVVSMLKAVMGNPEVDSPEAMVWRLPEITASEAELTQWRAAQEVRINVLMGNTQTRMGHQLK